MTSPYKVLCITFTAGCMAGLVPASPQGSVPPAQAAQAPSVHDPHARPVPVAVRLAVDASVTRDDSEELHVSAELQSNIDEHVHTAFAFEIVSDRGQSIVPPAITPSQSITAHATTRHATLGVPADLADGFYYAKATVAWKGTTQEGTSSDYLYFHLDDGHITVIDADDWYTRSAANEGVFVP